MNKNKAKIVGSIKYKKSIAVKIFLQSHFSNLVSKGATNSSLLLNYPSFKSNQLNNPEKKDKHKCYVTFVSKKEYFTDILNRNFKVRNAKKFLLMYISSSL